jgi:Tfp pilus assembly protein PilX
LKASRRDRVAPSGHRADGGFALLEIFIALLILSVGLLSLAMVQLSALTARAPSPSSGERVATNLAQATQDRLAKVQWEELASSRPDGFLVGPGGLYPALFRLPSSAGDATTVGGTTYYRIWQVAPDAEIPALKTVTVWCLWRQGEGSWRQVVLVTQRSKAVY